MRCAYKKQIRRSSAVRLAIDLAACTVMAEALEGRVLLAAVPATAADSFVDTIGIGNHYVANGGSIIADLGIRHMRTGFVGVDANYKNAIINAYNSYGISSDLIHDANDTKAMPQDVVNLVKSYPAGVVEMVEGQNEADYGGISYCSYKGVSGWGRWEAAKEYGKDVYALLKGDAATRSIPYASYTLIEGYAKAATDTNFDLANMHIYMNPWQYDDSRWTSGNITRDLAGLDSLTGSTPKKATVVTEMGYQQNSDVTELGRAKYLNRMLGEMFLFGVKRTYVFQLDGSEGWRIAESNGTLFPAGKALKGMIDILEEGTWNPASKTWTTPDFKPGALDYQAAPNGGYLKQILLQKSNGDYYLMLWNEGDSHAHGASPAQDINSSTTVNLTFKSPLNANATWYTMNDDGTYTANARTLTGQAGSQALSLTVPDRMTILKLSPGSASYLQTGAVYRERWDGIAGGAVAAIPAQTMPAVVDLLGSLETTSTSASFGERIRGYLSPPQTGLYTFWLAGDDEATLRVSRSEKVGDSQLLANIPAGGTTGTREWTKYGSQKSMQVYLVKNNRYYFEVLHKQDAGAAHVAIGWSKPGATATTGPDEIIPGTALSRYVVEPSALGNTSFETPSVPGGYVYNPYDGTWGFSSQSQNYGSGVTGNNSPFTGSKLAPDGTQVGFVQGAGSIRQSVTLAAGQYELTFKAVQRSGNNQRIQVRLGGRALMETSPAGTSYTSYSTGVFTASADSYLLEIVGLNPNGGDNTALLDQVDLRTISLLPIQENLSQGGFESPALGGPGAYAYAPVGSAWSFGSAGYNTGSGISRSGAGGFGSTATEGSQVAFVQGSGWISQSLTSLQIGAWYQLNISAAQRSNYGVNNQDFDVLVDGIVVGTYRPAGAAWQSFTTAPFHATATSHSLQFVGRNSIGGDNTAFIDVVGLQTASAPADIAVSNDGFESPALASPGAYAYAPTGAGWTFGYSGYNTGSGISRSGSGGFGSTAYAGSQVGFVQGTGWMQQVTGAFEAGRQYLVSFAAAQRSNNGLNNQDLQVLLDGVSLGSFRPVGGAWQAFATAAFQVAAGTHTLKFVGLNSIGGDNTAFIDAIRVYTGVGQAMAGPLSMSMDVGSPTLAGSATYIANNYTLGGSGRGIAGATDQFRFVSNPVSGDSSIATRVDSLSGGS